MQSNDLRSLLVRPLPLLNLHPRTLVDGIVDGHDGLHVGGTCIMALTLHSVKEHLF